MHYTKEQMDAIGHREGNLLILACAGSGKTEVISKRIALLVNEGVKKSEIIAFTFTERAAHELKARIRRHLEKLQPDDPSLGDMYVGTIHSFCLQLLKEIDPGYRKYEVMDEHRQAALIMTNFHCFPAKNDMKERGIGLDKLRARTRTGRYWDTVRTFITTLSVIYQKGLDIESVSDSDLNSAVARYKNIAYGWPNYFFDFDSIIGVLLEKLSADQAELQAVRDRFKFLVVDEYQDLDRRQEELIRLLSNDGKNVWITAVGDDDQAIYGWRGARIENILTFKNRYLNTTEIKLVDNFRSTHAIVDIANSAIRRIPGNKRTQKDMVARYWDESAKEQKFLESMAEFGDVQLRTFQSEEDEANWVADRIEQLRGTYIIEKDGAQRAIDYADMAILLRSVRSSGRIFADVLQARNIRVVVKGTGGLFEHEEVLLVQATFCLLARSDLYLESEDGPIRISESEIRQLIREKVRNLRERNVMPHAKEAVFLEWISAKREELDKRNLEKNERGRLARRIYPQDIFQEIIKHLGSSLGEPWPQDALYNLGRLSGLITQFEAVHQWLTPNDLGSLCIFLGGWAAGQVDEGGLDELSAPNAVQIMTVHGAKGLEWPAVFLPRVSSSNFPSSLRNRGPDTFLDEQLFDRQEYAGGDDGERRLWYVALTRCRKFLNISSLDRVRKRPTPYFKEITHDRVQRKGPISDRPRGNPTPPADLELLPTTYTDLNYFWRCPFEYQLRALMGFGPGVTESYGYGQQIHNILAEVHKCALSGKHLTKDEMLELVDQRFHLRYTRDGDIYKPLSKLRDAAKLSLKRYMENYPDSTQYVLEAEKPFEFVDRQSGALISGTVDLLERIEKTESGESKEVPVAVVDYKTHRWEDAETFNRKRKEVEAQLLLYAVAVRKALGFEAQKARAHFLTPTEVPKELRQMGVTEVVDVDVSESKQEEIRSTVRKSVGDIAQSIKAQKFEMSGCDHGYCPKCDFRQFCPGYARWDRKNRTTPRPRSLEGDREKDMRLVMEDVDAGQKP